MADKSWKAYERRMCKDAGTERIPVTGERHGADGQTGMFCYQFKLRQVVPWWIIDWLAGIVNKAIETDRVGVLVLKRPGDLDRDSLVVVRWKDWVDLHGAPNARERKAR